MSVEAPSFDWETGATKLERLPDKAVSEFVTYFLSTRAWHDDIEAVHTQVRKLRRAISATKIARAAVQSSAAAGATT